MSATVAKIRLTCDFPDMVSDIPLSGATPTGSNLGFKNY